MDLTEDKQRLLRVFVDAGATSMGDAKSARDLGLEGNDAMAAMIERGWIRTDGQDESRLWFPVYSRELGMSPTLRRRLLIVAIAIIVLELIFKSSRL
jgi:hypothetical protein